MVRSLRDRIGIQRTAASRIASHQNDSVDALNNVVVIACPESWPISDVRTCAVKHRLQDSTVQHSNLGSPVLADDVIDNYT